MRALVMKELGDTDQLEITDMPEPQVARPDDVLIRLKTAALNRLDLFTLGGLPNLQLDFPHVLGADGAGVVERVGPSVSSVAPGERVLVNPGLSCYHCNFCWAGEHSLCVEYGILGEHRPGTLAEFIVVPERNVWHIPELAKPHAPISWQEAGCFGLATLTAWRMLATRARVRPGEWVFIWGIGSGVSLAALKIAKLLGAEVIVTSSSDRKLEVARKEGADHVLNHNEVDVPREVRRLTGKRGADVVVDHVGEATWNQSVRSLAPGGRLVTCGGTSGPMVTTDVRRLFWYQYSILGSTMGNHKEFGEIVRLLGQGKIRPTVDSTYPLESAVEAFTRMQNAEQVGKLVIEIS